MLNKKDKEGNAMLQLRQRPPRYLGERERENLGWGNVMMHRQSECG
jgi:hypothetical protein